MNTLTNTFKKTTEHSFAPFSSLFVIFGSIFQGFNEEKQQRVLFKERTTLSKVNVQRFINKLHLDLGRQCKQSKLLARQINFHINSFSQLSNEEMSDFKDCENLVHVLELDDKEVFLQEIESVCSNFLTGSTVEQTSGYDDSSEVEDMFQGRQNA